MTSTETNSQEYQSNITFIIHYRKDCEDREHNLIESLKYLNSSFPESKKIIVNDDKNFDKKISDIVKPINNCQVLFLTNDLEFRKTLSFNEAANNVESGILCFWDVDVLIKKSSILEAHDLIIKNIYDHVYPFNGTFIDVQKDLFQDFLTRYNFEYMEQLWSHKHPSLHFASGESPGGCTMISKEAFNRIGGYDDRFIGWGFEDTDFLYRSRKTNKVAYLNGDTKICWHLHHDNSKRMENPFYNHNLQLFNFNNANR